MESDTGAPRPLFGGALSAWLPPHAVDMSERRQIPDNQEVFAHRHTDQSLIVELLEFQAHVPDQDAARFHFQDIAESNGALLPGAAALSGSAALEGAELRLTSCRSAWTLSGTQSVSKFNEQARNVVGVHLGLFRLPQFSTDILVTFNDPQNISPHSSSAPAAEGSKVSQPWTLQDFLCILRSLTLHDPGLFG